MKLFKGREEIPWQQQEAWKEQAKALLKGHDVKSGDIIICKADTQMGTLFEWLVCQELGLIPFFVSPDYAVEHSTFMEYTDAEYVLSADAHNVFTVQALPKGTGPHYDIPAGSVIHMTSATTGKPKYILRTKEMLDLEIQRYSKRLQLSQTDVFCSIAPYFHAYSFLSSMLPYLYHHAAMVIPDVLFPRNIIELCREQRVTVLFGVPYFLDKMADTDEQYQFGDSIRYIISSGEKLTNDVAERFLHRFGIQLRQQFGSTETGTITFSEDGEPLESQGKPMPGVEITIEHRDGKNYMVVNTHGTMGYYIREKLFPIAEGDYLTNDLAHFDEEGRLYIDGRGDDVVIRAGEKINLHEIAQVVEKIPDVAGASVSVGTDTLKELTCRYNAPCELDASNIMAFCQQYLSDFQIPRHYIWVEQEVGEKANWKHNK